MAFLQLSTIVPIPRCCTSQARQARFLSGNFLASKSASQLDATAGRPPPSACPPPVWPSIAARSRLSESIRKLPVVTIVSPSATPLRISTRSLSRAPTFTIRGSKCPPSFAMKR